MGLVCFFSSSQLGISSEKSMDAVKGIRMNPQCKHKAVSSVTSLFFTRRRIKSVTVVRTIPLRLMLLKQRIAGMLLCPGVILKSRGCCRVWTLQTTMYENNLAYLSMIRFGLVLKSSSKDISDECLVN